MPQHVRIIGWNVELGRKQGYAPVYARCETYGPSLWIDGVPHFTYTGAWELAPDELEKLRSGASLILSVDCHEWPKCWLRLMYEDGAHYQTKPLTSQGAYDDDKDCRYSAIGEIYTKGLTNIEVVFLHAWPPMNLSVQSGLEAVPE